MSKADKEVGLTKPRRSSSAPLSKCNRDRTDLVGPTGGDEGGQGRWASRRRGRGKVREGDTIGDRGTRVQEQARAEGDLRGVERMKTMGG